jgi:transaldolase
MSKTQFLLDSCNPAETTLALNLLGDKLAGQTTNPTLLIKNPAVQDMVKGGKILESDLLNLYKKAIVEISNLIPNGSVSIEVYADENSTKEDLLKQANEFWTWIPNAHIKFPTIKAGLEAAEEFVNNGGRVNMTLVFSQEQALAVHLATRNAKNKGDVLVSPFVGRLDDIGINGLDLIANTIKMYEQLDSKVSVLSASLRSVAHLSTCVNLGSDLTTGPLKMYQDYLANPNAELIANTLSPIEYKELTAQNWKECNIQHDLTDVGLTKFVADWKGVLLD